MCARGSTNARLRMSPWILCDRSNGKCCIGIRLRVRMQFAKGILYIFALTSSTPALRAIPHQRRVARHLHIISSRSSLLLLVSYT